MGPLQTKSREVKESGDVSTKYNVAMESVRCGLQLEPRLFILYLFTFWHTGTIKSLPNELLAIPVCNVPWMYFDTS